MTVNTKHVHKLRRKTYKTGSAIFFCVDDCDYKIAVELSLGKKCRCNVCDNIFAINEYSIRAAKPRCNDCIKRRTFDSKSTDIIQIPSSAQNAIENPVIDNIRERINNLTVKEYNPDEDVEL